MEPIEAATPAIETMEPVSLGYACDLKYQLSRNLYFRIHPGHTERQFRNMLFRWKAQPSYFRRHIFDWQIAPFPAVCAYLERDFAGVFERDDLFVGDDGNVHHRTLHTIHPHDFPKGPEGRVTEAQLDAQYEQVRTKFDFLAERFRRHLETPGPYLYVLGEIRPLREVERLIDLLKCRNRDRRLHLLLVDKEGAVNQVLAALRGTVSKGWLPVGCDKPADRQWEGCDDAWNAILDRFPIGLPDVPPAVPPTEAQGRFAAPPESLSLERPPQDGWRPVLAAATNSFRSVFDYFGGAGAVTDREGPLRFAGAGGDEHFFCQFTPVRPGGLNSWAKLRFAWPPGQTRAAVILQDQDCHAPASCWETTENPSESLLIARLGPEVDHIRLVMVPTAGKGALPLTVSMEVHDGVEAQAIAPKMNAAEPSAVDRHPTGAPRGAMLRSVLKRFSRG